MLLQQIQLRGLLSFADDSAPIALKPLNILIGPNGSGKTNILEGIALLAASATKLELPIRQGGGMATWMHRSLASGKLSDTGTLEALVQPRVQGASTICHRLTLQPVDSRFEVVDESIEDAQQTRAAAAAPYFYFRYQSGRPTLYTQDRNQRTLVATEIDPSLSIVAQRNDSDLYPEIHDLFVKYQAIRFYRDWTFGKNHPARSAQQLTLDHRELATDASNLGLVVNRLRNNPESKRLLRQELRNVLADATDVDVQIGLGQFQLMIEEGQRVIPAVRLSDGTLRYLWLLCVLLDPAPPPLIVIEEPELGLHPDAIQSLARLLKDASARTQLVITTHSTLLVDACSKHPEDVLVVDMVDGASVVRRLDDPNLHEWLAQFGGSLSSLWMSGKLGGTRW